MEENIVNLFKNSDDYYMIFRTIFKYRRDLEFAKEIINIIIDKCLYDVLDYEDMRDSLLDEIDDELMDEYMNNIYLDILPKLNPANLMYIQSKNCKEQEVINSALNSNPYANIMEIINHQCFDNLKIKANDIDRMYFTYLILDILKNEQKQVSDIDYMYGLLSNVYIIGDKVLKIGRRTTFKLKYNKRYLKPVIRYEHNFSNEKIVVELTERVDTTSVTYRDLEMILNELKNKKIEWEDSSIDNIGRLLKPNKVYYKYPIYADTGYIKTDDSKVILPAGELVILDNDYVYDKEKSYVYKK